MKISGAESVVMQALWRESPQATEALVAELVPSQGWGEATVKTLINRLLSKGAITAERDGRRSLYRPALDRSAYVEAESQGLLDRLFEGRLAPMVSHFSKQGKLSPEDVAELRALLDSLDDGERHGP